MGSEGKLYEFLLGGGDCIGGYTIERLLGKGGMGAVYLVHASDGRRYALKVMRPDDGDARGFRARFAREAEFAMNIRHRNLVAVHASGEDEKTGYCYLVMDYMPGGSLADRLAKKRALSVDEAILIVSRIADALDVAHLNGVIHRDIKPDNILFAADGTPKLADLGVAKFEDRKTTLTTTGMVIGTPAYMAPEQMMDSRHIDGRADTYALGVVLYEMLAGRRPNEDDTAVELMAKAIKGEPLPDIRTLRPEVSAAVAYVLSLMCAPRPEARPATLRDVVDLFRKVSLGTLEVPANITTAPAPAEPETTVAPRGHLKWVVAAAVVIIALGGAAFGWWTLAKRRGQEPLVVVRTVTNVVERTSFVTKVADGRNMGGGREEHLHVARAKHGGGRHLGEDPNEYGDEETWRTSEVPGQAVDQPAALDGALDESGDAHDGPGRKPPVKTKERTGRSGGGNTSSYSGAPGGIHDDQEVESVIGKLMISGAVKEIIAPRLKEILSK